MKKKTIRILFPVLILFVLAALVWTFWTHTVSTAIPNRRVGASLGERTAEHTVEAIYDFSVDPEAFSEFFQNLGPYTLRGDPRSLIPFLFQPGRQVNTRILIGRTETAPYHTQLLWDGELLWVAVTPNHYLAYRPINTVSFQTALNRFVSEYEQ